MRRTDWRLGGRTVLRWRESLLAIALVGLGLGLAAGWVAQYVLSAPLLATAIVWVGMLVPIVIALRRSIPVGLLRFRPIDLLWGVGLALGVRTVQGVLAGSAWPSYPTVDGHLTADWWFTGLVAPVAIAPVIEEFFFRVVIIVALFTVLRRPTGGFTAGFVAWLVSTGLFIVAHASSGVGDVASVVSMGVLGGACGLLVLLTGRIWGAVLLHILFNATGVALALVGTFWV